MARMVVPPEVWEKVIVMPVDAFVTVTEVTLLAGVKLAVFAGVKEAETVSAPADSSVPNGTE